MLLGHWSSDALLHYIRKQVQEFTTGVSSKMIEKANFFTIPSDTKNGQKNSIKPSINALQQNNGLYFFRMQ